MFRKSIYYFSVVLCLILMGCQRGCTTQSTMDSESKTISKHGQGVEVTVNLIDYRHSKGSRRNIFKRKVTHSYGLGFDVKMGSFVVRECFTEAVMNPDKVDLDHHLKRAQIKLSKDKKHLALGIDGKVADVIHLYNNQRVEFVGEHHVKKGAKWSKLDIESFEDPENMLLAGLEKRCSFMSTNQKEITMIMDKKSPADTMHRMLLRQWPECSVAEKYYSGTRVAKLARNKTWKKYATDRGIEILHDNRIANWKKDETYAFLRKLKSPQLNFIMDSIYAADWGRKGTGDLTATVLKRINNKNVPFHPTVRQEIIDDARSNFRTFMKTGDSNYKREATDCMRVLIAIGDTAVATTFLRDAFGSGYRKYDEFDFLEVTYENFKKFTPSQRRFIIKNTPAQFEQTKDYLRSSYFRATKDIVDCSLLKEWKTNYPDDLDFDELPKRCGP